jgi:hypothetical protein
MVCDDALDPNDLKRANSPQEIYSDEEILLSLEDGGKRASEWMADAMSRLGIAESSFHNRRRKLAARGLVEKQGKEWVRVVEPAA